MKRLLLLLAFMPLVALAKPWWLNGSDAKADDFLDPELAFKADARVDGNLIHVSWVIADGYYLYKSRFKVEAESPGLKLDAARFPRGIQKHDAYLGTQEIYTSAVEAVVPYQRSDAGAHPLQVRITYQGCAEAGLCYPPIVKVIFPGMGNGGGAVRGSASTDAAAITATPERDESTGPAAAAMAAQPLPRFVPVRASIPPSQLSWVTLGIAVGALAFLLAGFVLRRGRRLDFPGS